MGVIPANKGGGAPAASREVVKQATDGVFITSLQFEFGLRHLTLEMTMTDEEMALIELTEKGGARRI